MTDFLQVKQKSYSPARKGERESLPLVKKPNDIVKSMNSMKLVIPLHFISQKKTPNDAVTSQRQSELTSTMNVME